MYVYVLIAILVIGLIALLLYIGLVKEKFDQQGCESDANCTPPLTCVANPDVGLFAPPRICGCDNCGYDCNEDNTCSIVKNGNYPFLSDCQEACSTYNCDQSSKTCIPAGIDGFFSSLNDCTTSCSLDSCDNEQSVDLFHSLPSCPSDVSNVEYCGDADGWRGLCQASYWVDIDNVHENILYKVCKSENTGQACGTMFISQEE